MRVVHISKCYTYVFFACAVLWGLFSIAALADTTTQPADSLVKPDTVAQSTIVIDTAKGTVQKVTTTATYSPSALIHLPNSRALKPMVKAIVSERQIKACAVLSEPRPSIPGSSMKCQRKDTPRRVDTVKVDGKVNVEDSVYLHLRLGTAYLEMDSLSLAFGEWAEVARLDIEFQRTREFLRTCPVGYFVKCMCWKHNQRTEDWLVPSDWEVLRSATPAVRRFLLSRMSAWDAIEFSPWLNLLIVGSFIIVIIFMAIADCVQRGDASTFGPLNPKNWWRSDAQTFRTEHDAARPDENYLTDQRFRFDLDRRVTGARNLFVRDFASLSFDIGTHTNKAEVSEYRGLIHWFRDVIEKLLSVFLLMCFGFSLSRAVFYLLVYVFGPRWQLCLIPLDVNMAVTFIGIGLIIDGFILVSTMTDAPGITRTLDSVIVVLAGIVVMLIEPKPGVTSLLTFTLGDNPWLVPILAGVIGLLFLVRWFVRRHSLYDMLGHPWDKNNRGRIIVP
jgi:hypothetical protein